MLTIARHRTAIARTALSRPIQLALSDGLIKVDGTLFDYGCGRGGDLARLKAMGIRCSGWDPVHCPDTELVEADVVSLCYVINVIENTAERAQVLKTAWSLSKRALLISARLETDASFKESVEHTDGLLTRRGTFQKLYQQHELREWIESTLGTPCLPAGPGIFYVFREELEHQLFLASRYHRSRPSLRIARSSVLYERHQDALAPLLAFLCHRGRMPCSDEIEGAQEILAAFGTMERACSVVHKVVGKEQWAEVETQRTQDLLIYLALSRFGSRPKLSELPIDLQRDIRAFFTSYVAACELADAMLFSTGDMTLIDRLCRQSKIGKATPAALYVHRSALAELDPILRLYEGCAQAYIGAVESSNIIKLHRKVPQVSYLVYPEFETDPHPALSFSLVVPLQTFEISSRHYQPSGNPPILHRKETFVSSAHPLRDKFVRLTAQEERFGLYESPERIGTREGWQELLRKKGVALRGHRIVYMHVARAKKSACD